MKKVIQLTKSFEEVTGNSIGRNSELSKFQILQILQNKEYYFNIWRTYLLSNEQRQALKRYDVYVVGENENWDIIAWKLYGDVQYWWVLAFFNGIINPFESLYIGQQLNILKTSYLQEFMSVLISSRSN